jgi:hypothetical protein
VKRGRDSAMAHSGAGMLRFISFSFGGLFGQQDEIHKHKHKAHQWKCSSRGLGVIEM